MELFFLYAAVGGKLPNFVADSERQELGPDLSQMCVVIHPPEVRLGLGEVVAAGEMFVEALKEYTAPLLCPDHESLASQTWSMELPRELSQINPDLHQYHYAYRLEFPTESPERFEVYTTLWVATSDPPGDSITQVRFGPSSYFPPDGRSVFDLYHSNPSIGQAVSAAGDFIHAVYNVGLRARRRWNEQHRND